MAKFFDLIRRQSAFASQANGERRDSFKQGAADADKRMDGRCEVRVCHGTMLRIRSDASASSSQKAA